ncbi:hypothetical protein SAMN04487895_10575 [Paenibacillus sophorae]|uniref:Uncharacterized protein n=1 Tax=Paenibacillus sophorae TaxID=1333845 RepID=A0A1H8M544_9BACL|nr:hypothetical protein SAMN04487895_10575 [Paenibacillus sophorae]
MKKRSFLIIKRIMYLLISSGLGVISFYLFISILFASSSGEGALLFNQPNYLTLLISGSLMLTIIGTYGFLLFYPKEGRNYIFVAINILVLILFLLLLFISI